MGYNGTPWSKTQYYRRKRVARRLNCSIYEIPDRRGKHSNHASGPAHGRWATEKIISSHGYVKVRVGTDHPLADPNGYAYEHLLVWVSAGRSIKPGEVLHHINGCQQDNRLSNLRKMTKEEHNAWHNKGRKRDELGRFVSGQ